MFQGFGDILNLVPLAENVIKLSAVCMTCNSDGHFTKRMTTDTSVSDHPPFPLLKLSTVKFQNFRIPENFAVIYLKFKRRCQNLGYFVKKMQME